MYRGTAAYSSIGYGMSMSSVEILIGRMLSTSEGQPSLGFCAAPLLKPDICVYLCLFFSERWLFSGFAETSDVICRLGCPRSLVLFCHSAAEVPSTGGQTNGTATGIMQRSHVGLYS